MTQAEAQILELFQTLGTAERARLAERLYEQSRLDDFDVQMTPGQRSELEESIKQANRGEVVDARQAFREIAEKYGFGQP